MKLVLSWLRELCPVGGDAETIAHGLGCRGFEVAAIESSPEPAIDFEITANRPDCLSVIGLAREASAAWGVPIVRSEQPRLPASGGSSVGLTVTIEDPAQCPRYCAQVFAIRGNGAAPHWMRSRLEAAGVRSISGIVDVTNYVMLELGQPTHAFDLSCLSGGAIRVRPARARETLQTLDGVSRTLEPSMLVIADAERAQAVAGVMGGASSEIGAATTMMVLESACFMPGSVRRTSKRLALKTEASTRFERGADINAAPAAIARAAALFEQLGVATAAGAMIDVYPDPREPLTLTLRADRISRVLGMSVSVADVTSRLEPLGFRLRPSDTEHRTSDSEHRSPAAWSVTVPSFRVDVLREVDLIEEVARHDGYAALPATFPALGAPQPAADARTLRDRRLRHVLTASGLSEAVTFAFVEAAAAAPFAETGEMVPVANPLSEKFAVLRPSLLPGLIDSVAHNRRREQADVRLFETGARFGPSGEGRAVAAVWCGAAADPHWTAPDRAVDFYDIKGVAEAVCATFGVTIDCTPATVSYLVTGRSATMAAVRADGTRDALGVIGQIVPAILAARGIPAGDAAFAMELDLDALARAEPGADLRAVALPKFPSIVRDVSVLVPNTLPAAAVRGTIRSSAPASLVQISEFDRYRGKGVPEGQISLSLRLTFRSPERTMTDAEVDGAMTAIVEALAREHGAVRR